MTKAETASGDAAVVTQQIGRPPREPWRVAARCSFGYPTVIASPSKLSDGSRFPTLFWLTCPHLADIASDAESRGELQAWSERAAADPELARRLQATDARLAALRADESAGVDECEGAGVAGRSQSGAAQAAKCLHARLALVVVGVGDPIGEELLRPQAGRSRECDDARCEGVASYQRPIVSGP